MSLRVAVLVKQVPDIEAIVQLKSETELDIENRYVCSFFDEVAIEAALAIRKAHPDTELMALSAGGRRAVDALRRAVAMGIDRVEHLGDESLEKADSLVIAQVLAKRLAEIQPQLVLCGKMAGDDDQAAVGPMLAELMGFALAAQAVALHVNPGAGTARVECRTESELITLDCSLPLVVTAEKGLAVPHVPVVTRVMKAMKAKIENLPASIDSPERIRFLRYQGPPTRPKVKMIEGDGQVKVDQLVRILRDAGVVS